MAEPEPIKGAVQAREPDRWERSVLRRSAESRATVPELVLERELAADGALALAERRGVSVGAVVARACALTLRDHPRVNSAYRDGHFESYGRINLGWIVAAPDTYVIPTVLDADRLELEELAHALSELEQRAIAGELAAPELAGATFTLWDAGSLGLTRAAAPIVPPQAALLTAGAARSLPGGPQMLTLTLACDHRILYGAPAAEFVGALAKRLEERNP